MHLQIGKSKSGDAMHYSVGAIIKQYGKFLLIDRASNPPVGFAVPAGHINDDEAPEAIVVRTVAEESGLAMTGCRLVYEGEVPVNWCTRGICVHYWRVYECEATGVPALNILHAKSIGWYTVAEIKKLSLDPAMEYLFKKMKLL